MTLRRLRFHAAARAELVAATAWYEQEREGLGRDFALHVEAALERVVAAPLRWPLSRDEPRTRYVRLRRFPYDVVYAVLPNAAVVVVAIAHEHREPGYWSARLSGGPRSR